MSKILNNVASLAKQIYEKAEDPVLLKEDLDTLMRYVEAFPKYFDSVIRMETFSATARFRYEGDDLLDKLAKWDSDRRLAHIMATSAINKINRLCKVYEMDPIFEIPGVKENRLNENSITDRKIAADIIYGFCKEVYLDAAEKERYNQKETSFDQELSELQNDRIEFYKKISVDDLIKIAKEELDQEHGPSRDDDDVCL